MVVFTIFASGGIAFSQHELTLMCARMFPEESDKIERYVGGLPDMIHGSVMASKASKPKTMQDAIEFAIELTDKKINTFAERQGASFITMASTVKYANCKRVGGHLTRDCRSPAATNNQRNITCYECGNQGHYYLSVIFFLRFVQVIAYATS
nr:hypothetical protein [Tanacetum cinerariifolium]